MLHPFSLRPVALAVLSVAALPAVAVQLQVTSLPFAPGMLVSEAMGVNSKGQVVGISLDGQNNIHAWYWSAATGTLKIGSPRYSSTFAWGINEQGTVLGNGAATGGTEAFTWRPEGGSTLLGTDGKTLHDARGINNLGTVVGIAPNATGVGSPAGVLYPQARQAASIGVLEAGRGAASMAVNDRGTVVGLAGVSDGTRAFIWTANAGMRALDTPIGSRFSEAAALNAGDDVVGSVLGSDGIRRAAIWQSGAGAPLLLSGSGAYTVGFGINDGGQVIGLTGPAIEATRSFLWSRSAGMVDVDSLLVPGSGASIQSLRGITADGVMVGRAASGQAVVLTPTGTLSWQGAAGGSFSDTALWEHGFAPSRFVDVVVAGRASQTVTMHQDTSVKSLSVGGGEGRPTVMLQNGARLTGSVTVSNGGTLAGDGRIAGSILNRGTVQPTHLRVDTGLTNEGTITGTGRIDGVVVNRGAVRVGAGQSLVLAATQDHLNTGRVEIRGGELETHGALVNGSGGRISLDGGVLRATDGLYNQGNIEFGFGRSAIDGSVVTKSGGRVLVSGTGQALFNDGFEVESGGELRVAAGSQALFYGLARMRSGALLTGTGTKFFEAGLAIGNSPGTARDEGSISFGSGNIYEAELGVNAHDRFIVDGELRFGGVLRLVAWDGFDARAGQRFDLFDWGSAAGQFDSLDISGLQLGDSLRIDSSRLYVDGSIAVTAVPEPTPSALLAVGLAVLALRRLRRPSRPNAQASSVSG